MTSTASSRTSRSPSSGVLPGFSASGAPLAAWVNTAPVIVLALLPVAVTLAALTADPGSSSARSTPQPSLAVVSLHAR